MKFNTISRQENISANDNENVDEDPTDLESLFSDSADDYLPDGTDGSSTDDNDGSSSDADDCLNKRSCREIGA